MGSSAPPETPATTTTTTTLNTNGGVPPHQSQKPIILHLGDPIQHNHDVYNRLLSRFHIIHPAAADLERSAFERHLRERTWGDFSAIMRPFWRSGNTMAPWNEELIKLLPGSMQVMASAGAGYDWVDERCLAEHGIIYCNGAGASTESVADTALWFIISVFRNMTASLLAARSCSPSSWLHAHSHLPTISHNPGGHTLGIVGLGNIGLAIAKRAYAALGMRILYTDLIRKSPAQEAEVGAMYYSHMTDMLPHCACVLLATPAGPPLLTASTIAMLPRGARVINIARGKLIDENALADALESGHISAAGLDVHEHEPGVNEHAPGVNGRMARMPNVTMTSHTGGGSVETNVGFELLSMQNCERVLSGELPLTAVNLQWLRRRRTSIVLNGDEHPSEHPRHLLLLQQQQQQQQQQQNQQHDRLQDGVTDGNGGRVMNSIDGNARGQVVQDDEEQSHEVGIDIEPATVNKKMTHAVTSTASPATAPVLYHPALYAYANPSMVANTMDGTQHPTAAALIDGSISGRKEVTLNTTSMVHPPADKLHDADHANGVT